MKAKVLIALALLAAVFLGGFLPQYLEARRLKEELAAARQELGRRDAAARLHSLRQHVGFALLETTRKNFGLAQQHMTEFYKAAGEQNLPELLKSRDAVVSRLATADAGVQSEIESLFVRTYAIPIP